MNERFLRLALFFPNLVCEMETEDNAGDHKVSPEGSVTLLCDSDDAIFVSWIQNDVNIANGTKLTLAGVVQDELYFCRVWGPRCNRQLAYRVIVVPFGKIPVIFNHVLLSFQCQTFNFHQCNN